MPLFGRSFIQSVSPSKDSIRPARSNLWIILLPRFALFISLSAAISPSLSACVLTSPHYFWLTLACFLLAVLLCQESCFTFLPASDLRFLPLDLFYLPSCTSTRLYASVQKHSLSTKTLTLSHMTSACMGKWRFVSHKVWNELHQVGHMHWFICKHVRSVHLSTDTRGRSNYP